MSNLKGIDISEHNGNVNMAAIKASGIQFVIIRASWGHFARDAQVANNVRKCLEVGMPYGLYHYSYATNDAQATQEAQGFLALANEFSGRTYPLYLDMEDADHYKRGQGVSDAQEVRTTRIFKNVIEGNGKYFGIYMNKDYWNRLTAIDAALINSIDLWLAHWGVASPSVSSAGMWQYTSDGIVNGNGSSRMDMNIAYKDYPALIKQVEGTSKPKPSVPPAQKPTPAPTGGVSLNNTPLYAASTSQVISNRLTGTYYYWDNQTVNGRRRITNSAANVGKAGQITGWIDANGGSAAAPSTGGAIKVGDNVVITKKYDVNGTYLGGTDSNPYQVIEANSQSRIVIGRGGAVTAAMPAGNLKKV